jgi:membrane fusion protein, copper/silver efflux system
MKKILNNKFLHFSLVLIAGLFIGWLVFNTDQTGNSGHRHDPEVETTYTCSMHPQIRQDEPGKCPLCGMELIPVAQDQGSSEDNPFEYTMSAGAVALANIQTQKVKIVSSGHEVSLAGKIAINEQKMAMITANYPGRIEKLFVDFTGQAIQKGQKLATIYSPELVTAQKELIEAARFKEINPGLYNASIEKLRLWKITDDQIAGIEESNMVMPEFDVYSDQSGVVIRRSVARGDYVNKGSVLFEITDLSRVWVLMDAYESDLPFLRNGQKLTFTVASVPGKEFNSSVSFIDPFINPQTRTASVRAEVNNPQLLLKHEMFVNAMITASFPVKEKSLVIPATALLWTGKRSVVYVKVPNREFPVFEMREITLGPSLGGYYMVLGGLAEDEEVVVNGAFSVDAAAQLAGKPSMMNPQGGAVSTSHNHGGMQPGAGSSDIAPAGTAEAGIIKTVVLTNQAKSVLQQLFATYLKWKNALVADNFNEARQMAGKMKNELGEINMNLFTGAAHDNWMSFNSQLNSSLEHVQHLTGIEALRKAFQLTSVTMISMAQAFSPLDETLYIQHCPMADDDKGADWLSLEKEIRNPYFGSSMLTCGEVIKTIK